LYYLSHMLVFALICHHNVILLPLSGWGVTENILSSLDELTIYLLKKIEEGHSNRQVEHQQDFSKFKDKLRQTRTQISKIQNDQMKHINKSLCPL
jgi:hypothetical protein